MTQEIKEKLEKVVELVQNASADPDIEIEYCIPEVATTSDSCEIDGVPYIEVRYRVSKYISHKRKIRLEENYLKKEPEEIADLVTFYIEQFKAEVQAMEIN